MAGFGGPNPQIKQQKPVTNYHFVAADNLWKINLTRNFIALSTLRYTGWEDFAKEMDKPLAEFIRIYKPAYFERVGLRYVNIISREKLSLRDSAWTELIAPAYLGAMAEPDVLEENVLNSAVDLQCKLDSGAWRRSMPDPAVCGQVGPTHPRTRRSNLSSIWTCPWAAR